MNWNERFVRPRLDPPGSAPGIHHNLLTGARTGDTPCDCINSFAATLRRWRNLSEFNGRTGGALPRLATVQHNAEHQQQHSFEQHRDNQPQFHAGPTVPAEQRRVGSFAWLPNAARTVRKGYTKKCQFAPLQRPEDRPLGFSLLRRPSAFTASRLQPEIQRRRGGTVR